MMAANIDGSGTYPYAFGKLVASVMSIIMLLMTPLSPLNAPQITRLIRISVIDLVNDGHDDDASEVQT